MSSEPIITVRNVSKVYRTYEHPIHALVSRLSRGRIGRYREFKALQDISLEIRRGETVGIIGRNGAGKSTLLQLICKIRQPSAGSIEVGGRISALLELGAGFHPDLTGRENVYLHGAIMGISAREVDHRFDSIGEFAGIGEYIDMPVSTYSTGMFVRLAFATAINVDPDILFVDEALAVGDAVFRARCYAKFEEFRAKGNTIVFVTHDLNQIVAHCDRAILLDRGRIVANGSSKEVVDHYRRLLCQSDKSADHGSIHSGLDWQAIFHVNADETRYGDRLHEVIEAGIFGDEDRPTQVLRYGETCSIRIRLAHHAQAPHPFASFVIKDVKGVPVSGSTTEWEGVLSPMDIPTGVSEVLFTFPMLLNPGNYLLSLGIQSRTPQGELIAHDHRTDHLSFEVIGQQRHGIFSPPLECQWI